VVMKTINCFENKGVSTPRQFRRVVAQWEGLSGTPVGGKVMSSFSIVLSQTLEMESHPRPGPGGTRCTGEERLSAILNSGACYASVLSRPAALPGVSVLSESELAKLQQV